MKILSEIKREEDDLGIKIDGKAYALQKITMRKLMEFADLMQSFSGNKSTKRWGELVKFMREKIFKNIPEKVVDNMDFYTIEHLAQIMNDVSRRDTGGKTDPKA